MKYKALFTLFIAMLACQFVLAQQTEDVVKLKNKWIIRGKIIDHTGQQVSIKTKDRSVFVFDRSQIDTILTEEVKTELNLKRRGFANFTELGPLAARNTSELNVNTSAFSFQTVNGFKFNQWFFAGAGLGADLYATQTYFPAFASIRGDLFKEKQFVPYYFVDAGYGFNGTINNSKDISFKGGSLYAIGMGLKVGLSRNAGVLISLGFRRQNYQTTTSGITEKGSYQRLALRAGFYL